MNARELRQKYLEFFESKGHLRHPSGSLIPYDVTGRLDESLLFNGAGMIPFKPYFRGVAQPPQKRLTNVQKCVRTGDIDEVGDLSHLTFFEMMGNFSFGDYFKKEAVALSWEFMTSKAWLGLDPNRLSFTVFTEDDEAYGCWSEHLTAAGLTPENRIFRLGEDTNYWPAGAFSNGPPGPCGPNSEMFYWTPNDIPPPPFPKEEGVGGGGYSVQDWLRDEKAGKWLEIWNDVFIQYEWKGRHRNPERPADGYVKEALDPLPFQSVDTGMGLERTATVLGGFRSIYETDVFEPVFRKLATLLMELEHAPALFDDDPSTPDIDKLIHAWATKSDASPHCKAARIIADHARTACFCIADGILPGNSGRGYVLRRLIRRAVLKGQRVLGIEDPFLLFVYEGVAEALGDHYTELADRREVILETLRSEEVLFRRTLRDGYDTFVSVLREHAIQMSIGELWNPDDFSKEKRQILRSNPLDSPQLFNEYFDGVPVARASDYAPTPNDPEDAIAFYNTEVPYVFPGKTAFQLYDTYGFPLEVTQELCQEAGIAVDLAGFEAAMKEAQERSRAAHGMESVYGGVEIRFEFWAPTDRSDPSDQKPTPTRFVGYDTTEIEATIVGVVVVESGSEGKDAQYGEESGGESDGESGTQESSTLLAIALDQTPFYPESGGEVSDTGLIQGNGFTLEVIDMAKQDGVYVHLCRPMFEIAGLSQDDLNRKLFNHKVRAAVDLHRRRSITRNHTATHLLHAALRDKLGKHVTQAGSLVAPDHLRFDFTHGKALTEEELVAVEREVNEKSLDSIPVLVYNEVPIDQAKERGAMALFGEKYGDSVRMVEVPGFSLELCGGCHVGNTAEIGLFKILHESSAASGVRRIEAVTGGRAYEWAREADNRLHQAAAKLKTNPHEIVAAVEKLQDQLREEKRRIERLRTQSAAGGNETITAFGPVELATQTLDEGDMKEATLVADRLVEGKPNRVAFVVLKADGKVQLVAKAGVEAVAKGAHAGNLVREGAKIVGGGGGGRPDFATAGGKDAGKVEEALKVVGEQLKAQVGA